MQIKFTFRVVRAAVACFGVCLGISTLTSAQEKTEASAKTESQDKSDDTNSAALNSSGFGRLLPNGWSLHASTQAAAVYDDNALSSSSNSTSDISTGIRMLTTLAWRGQHTHFEATYLPEFNLNRRYTTQNYSAHTFNQSLSHELSSRTGMTWTLNVHKYPGRSGSAFSGSNSGAVLVEVGPQALDLQSNVITGTSAISINRKMSERSVVSLSATGSMTRFTSSGGTGTGTPESRNYYSSASLVWDYTLGPRRTLGVSLSEGYFLLGTASDHRHYQTLNLRYHQSLTHGYDFSLAAGPSFSEQNGTTSDSLQPQLSLFASLTKRTQRNIFSATLERSQQLGFLQGTLTSWSTRVNASRTISRRWSMALGGGYTRSAAIVQSGQTLETYTGSVQGNYSVSAHTTAFINYGYTNQHGFRTVLPSGSLIEKNRITIGLSYDFGNLLGRL